MKHGNFARLLLISSCALLLYSLSACSSTGAGVYVGAQPAPKAGPPPHAPAHGYRAKHTYHYYPDAYVYFDIVTGVYYYPEGGTWKVSASLPAGLSVQIGSYVTIESDSDRPYTEFETHKKNYPPGQVKKKEHKKK
jgi:hypothetical protein